MSDDGRFVTFQSDSTGTTQIYLLDTETDTLTQITNGALPSFSPSISGDGESVYFHSQENHSGANPDLNTEVFLYLQSESVILPQTTTSAPASSDSASVSGDRSCFMYRSNEGIPDGTFEIFGRCISFPGPNTFSPGKNSEAPQVDRSGENIVFYSDGDHTDENADGSFEVFLFERGAISQITDSATKDSVTPQISDGGSTVVFSSRADLTGHNSDESSEIFLFDRDTDTTVQLTDTTFKTSTSPDVSGNGRIVIFTSNADFFGTNMDANFELFSMRTDTGEITQRTETTTSSGPSAVISADGRYAVFSSNADLTGENSDGNFEIFSVRLDVFFQDGFESGTTSAWSIAVE